MLRRKKIVGIANGKRGWVIYCLGSGIRVDGWETRVLEGMPSVLIDGGGLENSRS